MNKPYWRVSYNGIGIYESLKKEIWKKYENPKQEWEVLKDSVHFTWLNTPPFYNDNCYSYFTELGYKLFIKNTFPILVKYLDENTWYRDCSNVNYSENCTKHRFYDVDKAYKIYSKYAKK